MSGEGYGAASETGGGEHDPALAHPGPSPWLSRADLLVGVDDTDDIGLTGTGRHVQDLMRELAGAGLGTALGATRHQLCFDERIPMTSHNCSACIHWAIAPGLDAAAATREIEARSARFLREHSAAAADPGLAIVRPRELGEASRHELAAYGARAKSSVLDQREARSLAEVVGVSLSGHGGTEDGVIGALAAVGLVVSGTDGLFLWMPGVRELSGRATAREVLAAAPIDELADADGRGPGPEETVELGDWVRPLFWRGRSRLLVMPVTGAGVAWRAAPRYLVKAY